MELKEVGVKFENQPKVYSFNPQHFNVKVGDIVVCQTIRGLELGKVVTPIKILKQEESKKAEDKDSKNALPLIVHFANKHEKEKAKKNKQKAKEYLQKTRQYIRNLNLDMKLVCAELMLDCSKIIISFTSEKRVDFRELVKLLASDFKMKIELRQIGARDEVKMMGGLGACGRPCCCSKNTGDFEKVNIKMAKLQGLSLNPANISGLCGRLLCCLAYENDFYAEALSKMPNISSIVQTPEGKGEVVYNNLIKNTVQVKIEDSLKEFPLDKIKLPNEKNNQKKNK